MRRILPSLLLCCLFYQAGAQQKELEFARHLYKKGYYREAVLELQLLASSDRFKDYDSLSFYTGLCYAGMGKTDTAIQLLSGLVSLSSFHTCGLQYSSLYLLETGRTDSALQLLTSDFSGDKRSKIVLDFQRDALELLIHKDTVFSVGPPEYRKKLAGYVSTMNRYSRRKPVLGGLLSALVPGLGKVYAGSPRQMFSSFIPLAIMGVQCWEGYRHQGLQSPRFWIFGAAFTVFYIGNIYGSALAVRIAKQTQYDITREQIMVDLRVSLHDLYGGLW
ncbi:MAG: hypothetical protein IT233_03170 [Bacteroidia bacterium]|nr:hypothetical protein [Bacteroidia bacterium]